VNGSVLLEESSVTMDRVMDSTSIYTLGRGYSGEAMGAPQIVLTVESMVPSTHFELDPGRFMGVMQEVEFAINAGAGTIQFNGFIVSDNFSHAINSNAKITFTAKGFFSGY
jgi:hypothetical protein